MALVGAFEVEEVPELRRRGDGARRTSPSMRRRDAGAGVGISPRRGAGCPARTSPRPGTGRAGGRRLEEEDKPPDDVLKARVLGADGGAEGPELRRRGDGSRKSPPDDAHKARALGADGGAEGPDSGGFDHKTEAGAGAGDEAWRREEGKLIS